MLVRSVFTPIRVAELYRTLCSSHFCSFDHQGTWIDIQRFSWAFLRDHSPLSHVVCLFEIVIPEVQRKMVLDLPFQVDERFYVHNIVATEIEPLE